MLEYFKKKTHCYNDNIMTSICATNLHMLKEKYAVRAKGEDSRSIHGKEKG